MEEHEEQHTVTTRSDTGEHEPQHNKPVRSKTKLNKEAHKLIGQPNAEDQEEQYEAMIRDIGKHEHWSEWLGQLNTEENKEQHQGTKRSDLEKHKEQYEVAALSDAEDTDGPCTLTLKHNAEENEGLISATVKTEVGDFEERCKMMAKLDAQEHTECSEITSILNTAEREEEFQATESSCMPPYGIESNEQQEGENDAKPEEKNVILTRTIWKNDEGSCQDSFADNTAFIKEAKETESSQSTKDDQSVEEYSEYHSLDTEISQDDLLFFHSANSSSYEYEAGTRVPAASTLVFELSDHSSASSQVVGRMVDRQNVAEPEGCSVHPCGKQHDRSVTGGDFCLSSDSSECLEIQQLYQQQSQCSSICFEDTIEVDDKFHADVEICSESYADKTFHFSILETKESGSDEKVFHSTIEDENVSQNDTNNDKISENEMEDAIESKNFELESKIFNKPTEVDQMSMENPEADEASDVGEAISPDVAQTDRVSHRIEQDFVEYIQLSLDYGDDNSFLDNFEEDKISHDIVDNNDGGIRKVVNDDIQDDKAPTVDHNVRLMGEQNSSDFVDSSSGSDEGDDKIRFSVIDNDKVSHIYAENEKLPQGLLKHGKEEDGNNDDGDAGDHASSYKEADDIKDIIVSYSDVADYKVSHCVTEVEKTPEVDLGDDKVAASQEDKDEERLSQDLIDGGKEPQPVTERNKIFKEASSENHEGGNRSFWQNVCYDTGPQYDNVCQTNVDNNERLQDDLDNNTCHESGKDVNAFCESSGLSYHHLQHDKMSHFDKSDFKIPGNEVNDDETHIDDAEEGRESENLDQDDNLSMDDRDDGKIYHRYIENDERYQDKHDDYKMLPNDEYFSMISKNNDKEDKKSCVSCFKIEKVCLNEENYYVIPSGDEDDDNLDDFDDDLLPHDGVSEISQHVDGGMIFHKDVKDDVIPQNLVMADTIFQGEGDDEKLQHGGGGHDNVQQDDMECGKVFHDILGDSVVFHTDIDGEGDGECDKVCKDGLEDEEIFHVIENDSAISHKDLEDAKVFHDDPENDRESYSYEKEIRLPKDDPVNKTYCSEADIDQIHQDGFEDRKESHTLADSSTKFIKDDTYVMVSHREEECQDYFEDGKESQNDVEYNAICNDDECEDNICHVDVAEDNICHVDDNRCKLDVAEDVCQDDVADDICQDDAADDICQYDLAEENICHDDVAEENMCQDDIAKDNICQDDIAEDNIGKIDVAEYNIWKIDVAKNNICHVDISEDICQIDEAEDNMCQDAVTEDTICQDDVADNICQDNVADDICQDDLAEENICHDDVAEDKICHVDVAENNICRVDISEDICQIDEAEDNICQDDVAEDNICHVGVVEDNIWQVDVAEDNMCQFDVAEDNICQVDVAEDNICQVDVAEDNMCQFDAAEDNICHVDVAEDNICQDDVAEDNMCQDAVTEDNICQDDVAEGNMCQDAVTEDNICQVDVAEDNICQVDVAEDNICQVDVAEDNICQDDVTEDMCQDAVTEDNICQVDVAEDNICQVDVTEDNICQVDVVEDNKEDISASCRNCDIVEEIKESQHHSPGKNRAIELEPRIELNITSEENQVSSSTPRHSAAESDKKANKIKFQADSDERSKNTFFQYFEEEACYKNEKVQACNLMADTTGRNKTIEIVSHNLVDKLENDGEKGKFLIHHDTENGTLPIDDVSGCTITNQQGPSIDMICRFEERTSAVVSYPLGSETKSTIFSMSDLSREEMDETSLPKSGEESNKDVYKIDVISRKRKSAEDQTRCHSTSAQCRLSVRCTRHKSPFESRRSKSASCWTGRSAKRSLSDIDCLDDVGVSLFGNWTMPGGEQKQGNACLQTEIATTSLQPSSSDGVVSDKDETENTSDLCMAVESILHCEINNAVQQFCIIHGDTEQIENLPLNSPMQSCLQIEDLKVKEVFNGESKTCCNKLDSALKTPYFERDSVCISSGSESGITNSVSEISSSLKSVSLSKAYESLCPSEKVSSEENEGHKFTCLDYLELSELKTFLNRNEIHSSTDAPELSLTGDAHCSTEPSIVPLSKQNEKSSDAVTLQDPSEKLEYSSKDSGFIGAMPGAASRSFGLTQLEPGAACAATTGRQIFLAAEDVNTECSIIDSENNYENFCTIHPEITKKVESDFAFDFDVQDSPSTETLHLSSQFQDSTLDPSHCEHDSEVSKSSQESSQPDVTEFEESNLSSEDGALEADVSSFDSTLLAPSSGNGKVKTSQTLKYCLLATARKSASSSLTLAKFPCLYASESSEDSCDGKGVGNVQGQSDTLGKRGNLHSPQAKQRTGVSPHETFRVNNFQLRGEDSESALPSTHLASPSFDKKHLCSIRARKDRYSSFFALSPISPSVHISKPRLAISQKHDERCGSFFLTSRDNQYASDTQIITGLPPKSQRKPVKKSMLPPLHLEEPASTSPSEKQCKQPQLSPQKLSSMELVQRVDKAETIAKSPDVDISCAGGDTSVTSSFSAQLESFYYTDSCESEGKERSQAAQWWETPTPHSKPALDQAAASECACQFLRARKNLQQFFSTPVAAKSKHVEDLSEGSDSELYKVSPISNEEAAGGTAAAYDISVQSQQDTSLQEGESVQACLMGMSGIEIFSDKKALPSKEITHHPSFKLSSQIHQEVEENLVPVSETGAENDLRISSICSVSLANKSPKKKVCFLLRDEIHQISKVPAASSGKTKLAIEMFPNVKEMYRPMFSTPLEALTEIKEKATICKTCPELIHDKDESQSLASYEYEPPLEINYDPFMASQGGLMLSRPPRLSVILEEELEGTSNGHLDYAASVSISSNEDSLHSSSTLDIADMRNAAIHNDVSGIGLNCSQLKIEENSSINPDYVSYPNGSLGKELTDISSLSFVGEYGAQSSQLSDKLSSKMAECPEMDGSINSTFDSNTSILECEKIKSLQLDHECLPESAIDCLKNTQDSLNTSSTAPSHETIYLDINVDIKGLESFDNLCTCASVDPLDTRLHKIQNQSPRNLSFPQILKSSTSEQWTGSAEQEMCTLSLREDLSNESMESEDKFKTQSACTQPIHDTSLHDIFEKLMQDCAQFMETPKKSSGIIADHSDCIGGVSQLDFGWSFDEASLEAEEAESVPQDVREPLLACKSLSDDEGNGDEPKVESQTGQIKTSSEIKSFLAHEHFDDFRSEIFSLVPLNVHEKVRDVCDDPAPAPSSHSSTAEGSYALPEFTDESNHMFHNDETDFESSCTEDNSQDESTFASMNKKYYTLQVTVEEENRDDVCSPSCVALENSDGRLSGSLQPDVDTSFIVEASMAELNNAFYAHNFAQEQISASPDYKTYENMEGMQSNVQNENDQDSGPFFDRLKDSGGKKVYCYKNYYFEGNNRTAGWLNAQHISVQDETSKSQGSDLMYAEDCAASPKVIDPLFRLDHVDIAKSNDVRQFSLIAGAQEGDLDSDDLDDYLENFSELDADFKSEICVRKHSSDSSASDPDILNHTASTISDPAVLNQLAGYTADTSDREDQVSSPQPTQPAPFECMYRREGNMPSPEEARDITSLASKGVSLNINGSATECPDFVKVPQDCTHANCEESYCSANNCSIILSLLDVSSSCSPDHPAFNEASVETDDGPEDLSINALVSEKENCGCKMQGIDAFKCVSEAQHNGKLRLRTSVDERGDRQKSTLNSGGKSDNHSSYGSLEINAAGLLGRESFCSSDNLFPDSEAEVCIVEREDLSSQSKDANDLERNKTGLQKARYHKFFIGNCDPDPSPGHVEQRRNGSKHRGEYEEDTMDVSEAVSEESSDDFIHSGVGCYETDCLCARENICTKDCKDARSINMYQDPQALLLRTSHLSSNLNIRNTNSSGKLSPEHRGIGIGAEAGIAVSEGGANFDLVAHTGRWERGRNSVNTSDLSDINNTADISMQNGADQNACTYQDDIAVTDSVGYLPSSPACSSQPDHVQPSSSPEEQPRGNACRHMCHMPQILSDVSGEAMLLNEQLSMLEASSVDAHSVSVDGAPEASQLDGDDNTTDRVVQFCLDDDIFEEEDEFMRSIVSKRRKATMQMSFGNLMGLPSALQKYLLFSFEDETDSYDLTKLLREIMQEARNLTDAERCSVFLIDKDTDELVAMVFDGITADDKE
ncbi:cGMP-dependent 3',5'-cyclic phosphodiesterase, partial [Plakobranchus ocellatus]